MSLPNSFSPNRSPGPGLAPLRNGSPASRRTSQLRLPARTEFLLVLVDAFFALARLGLEVLPGQKRHFPGCGKRILPVGNFTVVLPSAESGNVKITFPSDMENGKCETTQHPKTCSNTFSSCLLGNKRDLFAPADLQKSASVHFLVEQNHLSCEMNHREPPTFENRCGDRC